MKPATPFEVHRPVQSDGPSWTAIAASLLFHLVLIALLVLRPMEGKSVEPPPHSPDGSEPQPIAMPLPAYQKPQEKPTPKPPPVREQILGPDSKHPEAVIPKEAVAPHPPADPSPDPAGAAKPPEPVPQETRTPPAADPAPVESKASHFPTLGELLATRSKLTPPQGDGPPKALDDPARGSDAPERAASTRATSGVAGRTGLSAEDFREWRPSFPEAAGQCAEIPDLGTNPDGSPVLATVTGFVYDADGRTPLTDAHLQILGTAFTTFTDARGAYRLEFDPKLLKKCRIQYVQVVAPGHRPQQLMLSIGRKVRSDDVYLRRH